MNTKFPSITVLTRFHDIRRLPDLDLALFSLLGQNDVSVSSVILCQQLHHDEIETVKTACKVYQDLGLDIIIQNETFDKPGDHRAELLNRGFKHVNGRFVAFLDCDDVVYPSCYTRLIARIEKSGAAVAFAGCIRADQFPASGGMYTKAKFRVFENLPKAQFFLSNQYPIHSYVIDLSKVRTEDLRFDNGISRNEDYAFLLRLLSKYEFDDEECRRSGCEYKINMEGGNTIMAYNANKSSVKAWSVAEAYVTSIRQDMKVSLTYQDLKDFAEYQFSEGSKHNVNNFLANGAVAAENTSKPFAIGEENQNSEGDIFDAVNLKTTLVRMLLHHLTAVRGRNALKISIDEVVKLEHAKYRVTGWCAGGKNAPMIAMIGPPQASTGSIIRDFISRSDVADHLGSQDRGFGFEVAVSDPSAFTVAALCTDGRIYNSGLISRNSETSKYQRQADKKGRMIWNTIRKRRKA